MTDGEADAAELGALRDAGLDITVADGDVRLPGGRDVSRLDGWARG